uniref:ABC-type xenobiotic transporter n=1 Tax=Caenorhabditis japonica TaxID=281687 RepID=A0A8R1DLX2_CAEJA
MKEAYVRARICFIHIDYEPSAAMKVASDDVDLGKFTPKSTKAKSSGGSFSNLFRDSSGADYLFLLGGFVFSACNGALLPFNSLIFEGITNVLMQGEAQWQNGTFDYDTFSGGIKHYCLNYFLLGVFMFAASYLSNACLYTMCERRLHCIRKHYLRSVLRQDAKWFDQNTIGGLTQKMSSGVEKIKDGIGDKVGVLISGTATFISGVLLGFYMCWQLTLVMLVTVPLQLGSMYLSAKHLNKATKNEMSAYSVAGGMANEVIAGIRTVIAFNAQPFEIDRYAKQLAEARKMGIRKCVVLAICSSIPLILMFVLMAGAFWYGAYLTSVGVASSGTTFGVFWAVILGTRRLGEAAPHMGAITGARLAIRDIFKVIDHEPEINCTRSTGRQPEKIEGKLSFENIEFSYPTRPDAKILKGISFEVNAGETVALVGHSGCGKSTCIGLLMRFYNQSAGIIKLDGIPIQDYNIQWLRSTIGIVQQEPIIFLATVAENIRMGDESITDEDIEEACKMANAHEFISKLSDTYETVIGAGAVQLSGGQKQRVAIARAIVRKPQILLLDEATSALDTESERMVQAALDKASRGRTTLCIAHRLSTIRNASKILVFDNGLIAERGDHDQLIRENGIYANMIRAQEIEKSKEDTSIEDEIDMISRPALTTDEDELRKSRNQLRDSRRLSESMLSVTSQQACWEIESSRDELLEEGSMEASMLDIFRFAKPEKTKIIVALFFTIIRGVTWPAFSVVYGKLFKVFAEGGDDLTTNALLTALWFLLLAATSGVSTFISGSLLGKSGETIASRLRLDVFKNIMQQDAAYFDDPKHNVGNLTSRLATDSQNVQAAIDHRLAEVLNGIVSLLSGIAVAFFFGWSMAPIGLLTALLLVVAQSAVAQYLKIRGPKDMESAIEASRIITESISNWKTVQALTKQDYMFSAFVAASKKPRSRAFTKGLWQSLSFALAGSFFLWNFAIAYMFGLWLISNQWTTPFSVFQVIEALNMASMSVMMAASYFPEYVRARISAGIMFTMIRQKAGIDNRGINGEKPLIRGNIFMRGIYFAYPNRKRHLILDNFNMSANFGQTVALVGPSGCGKSTTIQLIERYYDALCGSVKIDDHDIRDISVKHLRDNIALVGQEPTLFNLTIRENITYGLENVTQEALEKAATLANIHTFIMDLPDGYDTSVGAGGGRLSGGQKQRIAIARAIVRDPKILLLDEATSALDTESEKIVQEALDKARLGRTCVVIAHRLSTIQNADKIIVCRNGKAIEEGTHQTLLARRGLYYRLVEKQST